MQTVRVTMDMAHSRKTRWQVTGWGQALGVAVLVMGSLAPVWAQEAYRSNTGTYLREAMAELEKPAPDFPNAFDGLQAAIEELRLAVAHGELEHGQGAAWMDRVTAVAGQVASDQLGGVPAQRRGLAKEQLLAGDASRAASEYREAIEHYRRALPRR